MNTETWLTIDDAKEAIRSGDGRGLRIAILDSGIEFSHPGLKGLEVDNDLAVVEEEGHPKVVDGKGDDLFGHGTAVAGIVHRLVPAAVIGSIRVLDPNSVSRAHLIQEGLRTAARLGYNIVHCSFNAPARQSDTLIYQNLIESFYLRHTHLVAAGSHSLYCTREWPAHFPTVVSVGAHPENEEGLHLTPVKSLVEFASCGSEVEALWPGGGTRQIVGAPFAAARVTAMLAKLLGSHPGLHPLTAKAVLRQVAE